MVGPRRAALVLLAVLPAAAAAAALPNETRTAFCDQLARIVAEENGREAREFSASLADAVRSMEAARARKVMAATGDEEEGAAAPPPLDAEDALLIGRDLWQRWMPTTPAARLAVAEDRPTEWLLAPAPGPEAPPAADPIRVDKATGHVTWKLPHPSERERLYGEVCGGE